VRRVTESDRAEPAFALGASSFLGSCRSRGLLLSASFALEPLREGGDLLVVFKIPSLDALIPDLGEVKRFDELDDVGQAAFERLATHPDRGDPQNGDLPAALPFDFGK
jgi:hypothetical protein